MTRPALAIDLGAFSTKVAWRDSQGVVGSLMFGAQPYLRTVFFLPENSTEILVGDEAQEAAEDEPSRAVRGLKQSVIDHLPIRVTEDRAVDAETLLRVAFESISGQVGALQDPALKDPEVLICMPGAGSLRLQTLLRDAAASVGWHDAGICRQEAALVRRAAFTGQIDPGADELIVALDCGASATRWVSLDGANASPTPGQKGGDVQVGGNDLDIALADWLQRTEPGACAVRSEARLQDQLRRWKETAFRDAVQPMRIAGNPVRLDQRAFEQVYREAILSRVMAPFTRYLDDLEEDAAIVVLMTGGASTTILSQAIEKLRGGVRCLLQPANAFTLSALVTQEQSKIPSASSPRRWRGSPSGPPSMLDSYVRPIRAQK